MTTPRQRYREFLEGLTPETLPRLPEQVTADVHFRDPFNDVRGVDAMSRVFRHMFDTLGKVEFRVCRMAGDGDWCLMEWRFESQLGGKLWAFDGTSRIRFSGDGRVCEHIDYWDAAGAFYERLPVIGRLLGWLRGWVAVRD